MSRLTYRFRYNVIGFIGAILFIAPIPLSGWVLFNLVSPPAPDAYQRALAEVQGRVVGMPSRDEIKSTYLLLICLSTISAVGFSMMVVGRDAVGVADAIHHDYPENTPRRGR